MKHGRKENPEFFKVYFTDESSERMEVPRAFVKYLDVVLQRKFKLYVPTKGHWYIKPRKIGDDLFFEMGWKDFVRDNAVVDEDFLVFKHKGGSNFRVTIYGNNSCEKVCGLSVVKCETPLSSKEDDEPEEDASEGSEETCTALEAAKRYVSDSKYPCFHKVMRACYLTQRHLALPSGFLRKFMKKREVKAFLQIGRKKWPVIMHAYKHSTGRLYGGWKAFTTANQLRVHDVCVFELIKNFNIHVLRVSIFREN